MKVNWNFIVLLDRSEDPTCADRVDWPFWVNKKGWAGKYILRAGLPSGWISTGRMKSRPRFNYGDPKQATMAKTNIEFGA